MNDQTIPTAPTQATPADQQTMAVLCHVLSLAVFLGIPFGNILGPLVLWLLKHDKDPIVDLHGKESLNFQISMTIYMVIAFLLVFVVIGIPLLVLITLFDLVMVVLATVKASKGEFMRYPLTIRFIR